ncbi:hypothetical protein EJ08DRAFT_666052 [Tothia fuscella]|uniref:Uncharacterized protein n=1 Tax=Tothia fuscella TaxID=1048955 RepID=A0A9P4TS42_9PEZI|nr:hypothetical protein EJ08DRAFT_666052 [Tothia fuscella]
MTQDYPFISHPSMFNILISSWIGTVYRTRNMIAMKEKPKTINAIRQTFKQFTSPSFPRELRLDIYEYVFSNDTSTHSVYGGRPILIFENSYPATSTLKLPAILLTSRRICEEALPIYFNTVVVVISHNSNIQDLEVLMQVSNTSPTAVRALDMSFIRTPQATLVTERLRIESAAAGLNEFVDGRVEWSSQYLLSPVVNSPPGQAACVVDAKWGDDGALDNAKSPVSNYVIAKSLHQRDLSQTAPTSNLRSSFLIRIWLTNKIRISSYL